MFDKSTFDKTTIFKKTFEKSPKLKKLIKRLFCCWWSDCRWNVVGSYSAASDKLALSFRSLPKNWKKSFNPFFTFFRRCISRINVPMQELSFYLSVRLSVCLSVYLSICLSVCQSVFFIKAFLDKTLHIFF